MRRVDSVFGGAARPLASALVVAISNAIGAERNASSFLPLQMD